MGRWLPLAVAALDEVPASQYRDALVEIVEREEERAFGFITGGTQHNFVSWRYALEPNGEGTTLTEEWALLNRSPIMIENGQAEVDKRAANAKESLGATLRGMKAAAEGRA